MGKDYGTVPTIEGQEVSGVSEKQGHVFCGVCCDVRRAVIIFNIIFSINVVINLVSLYVITGMDYEDDAVEAYMDSIPTVYFAVFHVIDLILIGIVIHGAVNFVACEVLVGLIIHSLSLLFSLLNLNIIGILVAGVIVYPHFFLYNEIRTGVMTQDNIHNEEQSCCCV